MTTGFLSYQAGQNNYNIENYLPVLPINKCTKPKHRNYKILMRKIKEDQYKWSEIHVYETENSLLLGCQFFPPK